MLILGQKSYILGPTIFKIPQPNWPLYICVFKPPYPATSNSRLHNSQNTFCLTSFGICKSRSTSIGTVLPAKVFMGIWWTSITWLSSSENGPSNLALQYLQANCFLILCFVRCDFKDVSHIKHLAQWLQSNCGGFQLAYLIITELKGHMTCYECSHWWKIYL